MFLDSGIVSGDLLLDTAAFASTLLGRFTLAFERFVICDVLLHSARPPFIISPDRR